MNNSYKKLIPVLGCAQEIFTEVDTLPQIDNPQLLADVAIEIRKSGLLYNRQTRDLTDWQVGRQHLQFMKSEEVLEKE